MSKHKKKGNNFKFLCLVVLGPIHNGIHDNSYKEICKIQDSYANQTVQRNRMSMPNTKKIHKETFSKLTS